MAQPEYDQIEKILEAMSADGKTPGQIVSKLLADSSSSPNMNVNGSLASPLKFSYSPPTGFVFYWQRSNFIIARNSGTFKALDFGHLSALTNGCRFYVEINPSLTIDLFPDPIKANFDFSLFSGVKSQFLDTRTFLASFDVSTAFANKPLKIVDSSKIVFEVRDNLSALVKFQSIIQGTVAPAT